MHATLGSASLGSTLGSFFDAAGKFFADLAAVHWGALLVGLGFFVINLTLRSTALFHTMLAAYTTARIEWRRIGGAYVAAGGFNNLLRARGGRGLKQFPCPNPSHRCGFTPPPPLRWRVTA